MASPNAGNCSAPRLQRAVQARFGSGIPAIVRRLAPGAPMARRRARMSDEGRFFILVLTSLAAVAAIAAIVAELAIVKDLSAVDTFKYRLAPIRSLTSPYDAVTSSGRQWR